MDSELNEWAARWRIDKTVLPILLENGYDMVCVVKDLEMEDLIKIFPDVRAGDVDKFVKGLAELRQVPVMNSQSQQLQLSGLQQAIVVTSEVTASPQPKKGFRCIKCHVFVSSARRHNQYNCESTPCGALETCPSASEDLHREEKRAEKLQLRVTKKNEVDKARATKSATAQAKKEALRVPDVPKFKEWSDQCKLTKFCFGDGLTPEKKAQIEGKFTS